MKEIGFLMTQREVKALIDGRLTQVHRVIKPQPRRMDDDFNWLPVILKDRCPYGQVGDRLWVRETWAIRENLWVDDHYEPDGRVIYRADGDYADRWKPSIYMPRWASRITLEITAIKVERVAEISEDDAIAEGIVPEQHPFDAPPAMRFAIVWDSINASKGYGWEANPLCWVLTFKETPDSPKEKE